MSNERERALEAARRIVEEDGPRSCIRTHLRWDEQVNMARALLASSPPPSAMREALEKIANMPPRLTVDQLVDQFVEMRVVARSALDGLSANAESASPPPSCERMEDGLHRIKQWADAYPVDVFRPISDEKLKEANEALKAIGVDMGALHAGWARHIVDGIGNIAREALDASRTEEKS